MSMVEKMERFDIDKLEELINDLWAAERLTAGSFYSVSHIVDTLQDSKLTNQDQRLFARRVRDAYTLTRIAWEAVQEALRYVEEGRRESE